MNDQFVGYRQGWNNVAAGTASGNENSQFRQSLAFPGKYRAIKRNDFVMESLASKGNTGRLP
jgi:hypothetical protein